MRDAVVPGGELLRVFDALPDVVFFIKGRDGRYTHVNQTLVRRLGLQDRGDVLGRGPRSLFPEPLGARYCAQDQMVLAGRDVEHQLEVHLFPDRAPGWCVTCKYRLSQGDGTLGVIGISRDLGRPDEQHLTYKRLASAVEYLDAHYDEAVKVGTLAVLAGMSIAQLERYFRRVFQLSPRQMLTKLRIDAAMQMLRQPGSIAEIAYACGYGDQSAFTRKFRHMTGLTPGQYRAMRG